MPHSIMKFVILIWIIQENVIIKEGTIRGLEVI